MFGVPNHVAPSTLEKPETYSRPVSKKKQGRLLEGKTYDEMPARIAPLVPGKADRLAAISEVESLITATC